MKRFSLFLFALALVVPAFAAPRRTARPAKTRPAVRAVGDTGLYGHLMLQSRNANSAVHANAIGDNRSARLVVIPAAGNVQGANGTFFRSDVTLVNYDTAPQDVVAFWIPQGSADNSNPDGVQLTLEAGEFVTFGDFVGTVLNKQGLGSIVIIPVAQNDIDFDGAIDGFSRIWTPQPSSTGTVSQPFPGVDPDSFYYHDVAAAIGLRQDSGFRTNYGIVNLDDVPHTFTVQVVGEHAQQQISVTVPGPGMTQTSIPAGDYGTLAVVFTVDDIQASWTAYASSTDNITGDGWVSIAAAAFTPTDLTDIGQ
ncbi:MAG TPA: hypothetical protein VFN10_02990 [Thermoanaerobaculia bacterium]|nr:hypothetical protein [Thermoanaerobaculia bacterium]